MWAEMCVAVIMSGRSLKGLTTGQNVCRKASLALWLVCARLHYPECRECVCVCGGGLSSSAWTEASLLGQGRGQGNKTVPGAGRALQ